MKTKILTLTFAIAIAFGGVALAAQSVGNPKQQTVATISSTAATAWDVNYSKPAIEVYNASSTTVYYGNSSVTSSTGIPLTSGQIKIWENTPSNFQVYFVTESGTNSSLRTVYYE